MRYKSKTERFEDSEFIRHGQTQREKTMDRETELANLKSYLVENGVLPFWANSAIAWVRQAMAGNTHWATGLHHPKLKIDKEFKCVETLTIQCTLHSASNTAPGEIRYEHKNGHTVFVKAIEPLSERKTIMEANEIRIGRVYEIKVGRNIVPVRIMKRAEKGGWEAVGLSTNNPMVISSAKRILGLYNPKANKANKKSPADAAKQVLEKIAQPLKPMSALDAAVKVLTEANTPLGCKQMMDAMLAKGFWKPSHSGKTPANTLHAAICAEIKKKGDQARFEKTGKGLFAVRTRA